MMKKDEITEEEIRKIKAMEAAQPELPSLSEIEGMQEGETEIITTDEAMAKITMELAKPSNIKAMSEVNWREVIIISALWSVANEMKDDLLKTFLTTYLELKISKERKGRGELIDMGKVGRQIEQEKGRLSRLFSGFK
jgi:hypothetical protein